MGSIDIYSGFEDMKKNERYGKDYTITKIDNGSPILVVAPHGGLIEGGTTEITSGIVDGRLNGYMLNGLTFDDKFNEFFEGLYGGTALRMHIKARCFREAGLMERIEKSSVVLAVHGWYTDDDKVYIGGTDQALKDLLGNGLRANGFQARDANSSGFDIRGVSDDNFINANPRARGVQIEVCNGLRRKLSGDKGLYDLFTRTIREVLLE